MAGRWAGGECRKDRTLTWWASATDSPQCVGVSGTFASSVMTDLSGLTTRPLQDSDVAPAQLLHNYHTDAEILRQAKSGRYSGLQFHASSMVEPGRSELNLRHEGSHGFVFGRESGSNPITASASRSRDIRRGFRNGWRSRRISCQTGMSVRGAARESKCRRGTHRHAGCRRGPDDGDLLPMGDEMPLLYGRGIFAVSLVREIGL